MESSSLTSFRDDKLPLGVSFRCPTCVCNNIFVVAAVRKFLLTVAKRNFQIAEMVGDGILPPPDCLVIPSNEESNIYCLKGILISLFSNNSIHVGFKLLIKIFFFSRE